MSTPSQRLKKRRRLLKEALRIEEFVRGSVVLMKRRCSSPGCRRCAAGTGHPTWVLTVSSQGKTRTIYLGEQRVGEAKRMVANYRRLLGLVEEVCELNLERLRAGRVRKGQAARKRGGSRDGQRRET